MIPSRIIMPGRAGNGDFDFAVRQLPSNQRNGKEVIVLIVVKCIITTRRKEERS